MYLCQVPQHMLMEGFTTDVFLLPAEASSLKLRERRGCSGRKGREGGWRQLHEHSFTSWQFIRRSYGHHIKRYVMCRECATDAVCIATMLRAGGSIPGRGKIFSSIPWRLNRLWCHPASKIMVTGGSFTGGKAAGAWNWPLTSISCVGLEMWSYTSIPLFVLMAWWLIN
jgi:hypothetical protein